MEAAAPRVPWPALTLDIDPRPSQSASVAKEV
jgi:hypothetical protein